MDLNDWLAHWTAQHPREIVMGLQRVRSVWQSLGAPSVAPSVITVAGTNGKGSTVAFIDSILRAGGYRVGRYTSPHLLRYGERIVVDGEEVSEATICAAFARIDAARADIPLTWFEAGTLAALLIFAESALDAAVLEVGLGGRLDAVNIIDAEVMVITSIALDHQDILGDTIDAIAVEKAGIARVGRPVVIAQPDPPALLFSTLDGIGATSLCAGVHFSHRQVPGADTWQLLAQRPLSLPLPALAAPVQLRNASAAVIAVLQCERLPLSDEAIKLGIARARIDGRLQIISSDPEIVLDVAHNPEAAMIMRDWLRAHPKSTCAVFSALADKDIEAIVAALHDDIDRWYVCGLDDSTPRGLSSAALVARISAAFPALQIIAQQDVLTAIASAKLSNQCERILVFGSFYLVAAVLEATNAA